MHAAINFESMRSAIYRSCFADRISCVTPHERGANPLGAVVLDPPLHNFMEWNYDTEPLGPAWLAKWQKKWKAEAEATAMALKKSTQWTEQWKVLSSNGRKEYIVSKCADGTFACSCPNWTRNFPREDCKHILKKRLEFASFPTPPINVNINVGLRTPKGRKFRD